ncbi:thiamine ABC transporter substrate binding subunit [Aliiroseovarius sp. YM-037]|uniref:thiamine ABC transporter substrate binding subunit n=1 Tax=Aliiroseovarius sp. YM-037 TaxID=3341728 RepID=UPI003A8111A8
MKYPLIAAGICLAGMVHAETPVLKVYTYDSFVSEWGPGPQIEAAFEETCRCDLQFVSAGDGAALLARVQLEGARSDADIVLGLDTNLMAAASETGLFAEHGQTADFDLPIAWEDATFLPYDWGYFAFVYDKETVSNPPESFSELAESDLQVVIQDPRSSTPGLGLLMWVKHAHGDQAAEVWQGLSDNVLTVTKGWSEAYGMFVEGEADMVLSYTTSPAYHLIAEEDDSKAAALFEEGHYLQVEVAAKLANSDQPELADQFLSFMQTDGFQSVIPTTNWMYPANEPEGGLPKGFETLIQPETALLTAPEDAPTVRDAALEEWLTALSR